MLIYTHSITNRCRYIFDTILSELLGLRFNLTDDLSVFQQYEEEKFAYTNNSIPGSLNILSTDLLFSNQVESIKIKTFPFQNSMAFFETPGSDFPFDIFAASFYLLSRYEEYLPSQRDQFGRFPGAESLAAKNGFLEIPVINYWVIAFGKLLLSKYPGLSLKKMQFETMLSFDIDVAYAYKGRSLWQNILAISADIMFLRIKNLKNRLNVIIKGGQDPYDTYDYISSRLKHYSQKCIFFFLLTKKRTRFDRNISPLNVSFKQLIKDISNQWTAGIHPSFYSLEKKELMTEEKKILEKISGKIVTASRQHFLRFKLPDTYRHLMEAGITDDYSMGYSDLPGFRAGIAHPFYFFDLPSDSFTTLKVHPVCFMEGSFMQARQNETEALQCIKKMIATLKDVNGYFLCIWHNHTVSEVPIYKGWKKLFNEMMSTLGQP